MDINKILKSDYLDIIFDGRNKMYGGYELRKKYPKRLRNAAAMMAAVIMLMSAYPIIAGILNNGKMHEPIISTTEIVLKPPPMEDPKTPPPPPPPPAPPAPPPPPKPTTIFTPPVVKDDDQVNENEKPEMPTKDEVAGLEKTPGDPNGVEPPSNPPKVTAMVDTKVSTEPFTTVEQMPTFKGDLNEYLSAQLNYPDEARENGTEGRSFIQFIVNEDGSISGVEVLRSAGSSSLDAEAKRVVAGMPKWNPGKQQGKPVKVYFRLPITFRLNG